MHEFDLIPDDYRASQHFRRLVFRSALGLGLLVLLIIATTAIMSTLAQQQESQIAAMQDQQHDFHRQRRYLTELKATKQSLERELTFLKGLRSGIAVSQLLQAIDQALQDSPLWFQDWQFQRANTLVAAPPQAQRQGYFILLPRSNNPRQRPQAIKQETYMSIRGQALDHAVLSRFLRRLYEQPQVADVYLNSTGTRQYIHHKVIEFDLGLSIRPEKKE
ncbi:MAG: hypothetical protein ACPGF7_12325 [Pontibacterium sp.]